MNRSDRNSLVTGNSRVKRGASGSSAPGAGGCLRPGPDLELLGEVAVLVDG